MHMLVSVSPFAGTSVALVDRSCNEPEIAAVAAPEINNNADAISFKKFLVFITSLLLLGIVIGKYIL